MVANLFSFATKDALAINVVGEQVGGWLAARRRIRQVVRESDVLLAGWGIGGLTGNARKHQLSQLRYLASCASVCEKVNMWAVVGEARHPSRWHQYVSDRYGRKFGGPFAARLKEALVEASITGLINT